MTPYPNPTKNQQNPMARFETGPMNTKPMASDLLKTKQSKNKKFEAKQKPAKTAGFFIVHLF